MMTPQEVSEHAFAKASFGGYNMAMVDEFLDLLTEDYTALYKENAVLKSKMKVLVDKVEEYRSTEDAMRKALLTAQRMADEMVAEAEQKRNTMLQSVDAEVRSRRAQIQQDVANEEGRLEAVRKATAAYVSQLRELYQHEMEYLRSLEQFTAAPVEEEPLPPVEEPPHAAAPAAEPAAAPVVEETSTAVKPPLYEKKEGGLYAELIERGRTAMEEERHKQQPAAAAAAPVESASAADGEDETAPTRRIDFSNLQFGRDYEIK